MKHTIDPSTEFMTAFVDAIKTQSDSVVKCKRKLVFYDVSIIVCSVAFIALLAKVI
jgi:hypothetical protein